MFNQYCLAIICLILLVNSSESQNSNAELATKLDQLNRELLRCHNEKRKLHQAPELKLNAELEYMAQLEAEKLAKLSKLQFNDIMYKGQKVGVNLWSKSNNIGNLGQEACESWYSRSNLHNFQGDWNSPSGAFTQMVWKNSKEMGAGLASGSNGWTTVVVIYYPGGNVISQFRSNVLPSSTSWLSSSTTTTTTKSANHLGWITASKIASTTKSVLDMIKSDLLTTKSQMQLTFTTKPSQPVDSTGEKEKLYSLIGKLYAEKLQ